MSHYDLVVLGAGPGGYVAAIRASQLGLNVAVIEKKYWGGVCLNVGCIPSKSLLRNAELAHILEHEKDKFGITGDASVDFGKTHERSRKVAGQMVKGVHYLMKKNKITEIDGWGTFTGPKTISVELNDGDTDEVTADNVIIAAGATTRLIPGTELSERVVTYEEQILEDEVPDSIIIAGSGAIGVEFAYVMANFGVDVTIVEFLDRMVPTEDKEVSKELAKHFKKLGVKVMTSTKVESIDDSGDLVTVTVSKDGEEQKLEAAKVMQAIGFAPRLEGYGLEETGVETTERGAIGVEFAYVMANFGVDVTIVEFLDRIVPLEEPEISKALAKEYKKLGVKMMTSTKVENVEDTGDGVKVTVTPADGESQTLEADKLLSAIGFAPRVEGFGLESTGVELTERGAIAIDDYMRTNVDGVYAIGDVTAKLMLAHTAESQGIVAAETLAGAETMPLDYTFIPRATYCHPQIASMGLTEQAAKDAGHEVKTAQFPFSANGKAMGLGDGIGFVKVVADAKYNEILGAHLIGPDVTELLPVLNLAQTWDLTADEMSRIVFAHPTLGEAVKEAVHGIAGHMINL